jgi:hypothetical protein
MVRVEEQPRQTRENNTIGANENPTPPEWTVLHQRLCEAVRQSMREGMPAYRAAQVMMECTTYHCLNYVDPLLAAQAHRTQADDIEAHADEYRLRQHEPVVRLH